MGVPARPGTGSQLLPQEVETRVTLPQSLICDFEAARSLGIRPDV